MWHKTKLTETLSIRFPIIQGPFGGGYSSVELVSTVSNLGGMGSFGAQHLLPQQIIDTNNEIRALTNMPYAINLWVSNIDEKAYSYTVKEYDRLKEIFRPYFEEFEVDIPEMPKPPEMKYTEQVEAILHSRPPAFSFVFGIPSKEILEECRNRNIKTIGTATTVDEAIALEAAGVDAVVATGLEAGGHRVSFLRSPEQSLTGTFSLVPQVADKLKIPVVAAGGIADGRGISSAIILGADGVQIGTAFLACKQSNASDLHKEQLFSERAKYTTLSKLFTGRMARGMESKLSEDLKQYENEMAPFPLQGLFLRALRTKIISTNSSNIFTFWAGQSAPLLKFRDATELFHALVKETGAIFKKER